MVAQRRLQEESELSLQTDAAGLPRPGGARRLAWRRIMQAPLRLLRFIGPGVITGASDDDPSGIGTYSLAGASLGYSMLWCAWVTFPLMAGVQYICAKVGLASGEGLAGAFRRHFSRKLLFAVVLGLFIANTINAGADIVAIAAGINLLIPVRISS